MSTFIPWPRLNIAAATPFRVRRALLVALALSLLLHAAWSMWPVDSSRVVDESPVLTATLTEMPAPPVAGVEPRALPPTVVARSPARKRRSQPRRVERTQMIAAAKSDVVTEPEIDAPEETPATDDTARASVTGDRQASPSVVASNLPVAPEVPPIVLPPRLDLAYKVFFGTRGFMIGDATYRFEHSGDRYRISTVAQARGLAALIVHGKGKIESRGRITPDGLRPYEFAVERGNPDKREEAYFDWDAGNVVLHDGAIAQLDAPAFDPLTILWQPYFSPPSRSDQTFSLATTRRVAKYTLSLEGEETVTWPHGDVATERWHRRSEDGKLEAWFWLAPSLHYIPVKMRIARTSGGTLEVLLDSIRADDAESASANAGPPTTGETVWDKPWNPMEPLPGPDAHGQ